MRVDLLALVRLPLVARIKNQKRRNFGAVIQ
jgi:hypothetical protein